ncbi:ectopic p granules protein 5-like protein [Elysia marginata]|uniref:Ectopic p granules protein 5-like protein n=1 Tax=Elysia marginata TaxID=1093978 RepID=A0AAV4ENT1_9GAST|nr:ectopic p granules protein 5-like protein [Elysia marginata]
MKHNSISTNRLQKRSIVTKGRSQVTNFAQPDIALEHNPVTELEQQVKKPKVLEDLSTEESSGNAEVSTVKEATNDGSSQRSELTDKNIESTSGSINLYKEEDSKIDTSSSELAVSIPAFKENVSKNSQHVVQEENVENQNVITNAQNRPELLSTDNKDILEACQETRDVEREEHKPSESDNRLPPLSVVEDPETPMSRVASPPSVPAEGAMFVFSPTVLVEEEKSPSRRAQEALAKLQSLTVTSPKHLTEVTASAPPASSNLCKDEQGKIQHLSTVVESQTVSVEAKDLPQSRSRFAEAVSEETSTKRPFAELSEQLQQMQDLERERTKVKVEAMPLSQLYTLYNNPELMRNEVFVEDFVQNEMKKEGHEFVDILSNYYRARHQLTGSEEDVKELQRKYAELQEEWWVQHTRNAIATVSSLLRVATFGEHLFVLNHILRCPAGVSQWAVDLVQCPVYPVSSLATLSSAGMSNPGLDHIITAMATVLMPVK